MQDGGQHVTVNSLVVQGLNVPQCRTLNPAQELRSDVKHLRKSCEGQPHYTSTLNNDGILSSLSSNWLIICLAILVLY